MGVILSQLTIDDILSIVEVIFACRNLTAK